MIQLPPPPHTHTRTPREGAYWTYLAPKDNYSWVRNCSVGPLTKYQKFLLSPKINLFGLHKIAWCAWQPIGHCSWVICKQAQDRHLRATHFFMDFFSLPLIQEKQAVSYWRNKMVAKQQRKTWVRESCIEQFTLPHNVKIHKMVLKKVCVPTK